jgi:hypothetical protein
MRSMLTSVMLVVVLFALASGGTAQLAAGVALCLGALVAWALAPLHELRRRN